MGGGRLIQVSSGSRKPLRMVRSRKRRRKAKPDFSFNKLQTIPNRRKIIPTKSVKTLKYVDDITLTVGVADTPAKHFFSCNGLYDPDITGTGHQPMGFDVIMPLYDHYVVIGATISVTFTSKSATTTGLAKVGIMLKDSSAVSFNTNSHAREQPRNISKMLGTMDSKNGVQTITYKVNPNHFLGRSSPLSDPDLKGGVTTNPEESCYFLIYATGIDQTSVPSAITAEVEIDYTAVWLEPKLLGQS